MAGVRIVGVHPVPDAEEPCHLIELAVALPDDDFDFAAVTQVDAGQPESNWQVAYDERPVSESETERVYAFFFHYLDFAAPLLTSRGTLEVPEATPKPSHLQAVEYEPPC